MGGPTPTPGGMCDVNGLLGRVLESKVMVESANDQGDTVENIVGGITGGGDRDSWREVGHKQQAGSKRLDEGKLAGTG